MFLDAAETIAGLLLSCGVGTVQCLFSNVYTLIGD